MSRNTVSACMLLAFLSSAPATAAELEVYRFAEVGVTATDNFRLGEVGEEEVVYHIKPSVELALNGNRFRNNLTAEVALVRFDDDESNIIDPRIRFSSKGVAVDNLLYLNSEISIAKSLNGDDYFNLSESSKSDLRVFINPYVSYSYGRFADLYFSYGHLTLDNETDGDIDLQRDNVGFSLGRNPKYGGLVWGFGGSYDADHTSGDSDYEYASAYASLGTTVAQTVFFQLKGGAESNNFTQVDGVDDQISTWEASLRWNPTARTSLRLGYGDRFFGEGPTLSFKHRVRNSIVSARLTRGLATSDVTIGEVSPFDTGINDSIVPTDELDLADDDGLRSDVPFVDKRLVLGYKIAGRRSDIIIDAAYSQQEELAGDATKDALVGRFVFDRHLSPLTTLRLQYDYVAREEDTLELRDEHRLGFRFIYNFDRKERASIIEEVINAE